MAQITISLPDDLDSEIRKTYEEQGFPTVSAFIADAVRQRLTTGGKLPYWDRVSMTLQLQNNRILMSLLGDKPLIEDKDWHLHRTYEVIEEGYEKEYGDIFGGVDKDGLSVAAANFVYDILDMYRDLQWSATEAGDQALIDAFAFVGFDGNRDYRLIGFTQHLMSHGRWEIVKLKQEHQLNSHGLEPDYRSMLSRYNNVRKSHDSNGGDSVHNFTPLTVEELHAVLGK